MLTILTMAATLPAQVSDADVHTTMQQMQAYLWQVQDAKTGAWLGTKYVRGLHAGGDTALVVQALLAAGVSGQHPRLARAINYLQRANLQGTYAIAVRAHVWALLPEAYRSRLVSDTHRLLRIANRDSEFRYGLRRQGSVNQSTTHFGALGVWEGAKRGVNVPARFWLKLEDSMLDAQAADGGWGYRPGGDTYGSMTAAGVTMLLLAQQQAHRLEMQPDDRLTTGIEDGLAWLDSHFDGAKNPKRDHFNYYYLFALERAALATGVRYLNGEDWFQSGARYLIDRQRKDGSLSHSPVNTAFGLIFLARGRKPLWATKLSVPGYRCNNRPNDLFYLSEYLSDLGESELNWQALSVNDPIAAWHRTPLVYLASDRAVVLDDEQKARLKGYLDRGGTLLACPDNGATRFIDSMRDLAAELYPQWPLRPLPAEHDVYTLLEEVQPDLGRRVEGVSNGVRELILICDADWGAVWQAGRQPGVIPAWRIMTNIWAIVTDRGVLPGRLVPRFAERAARPVTGAALVAEVRYEGNWQPEPAAWELFADDLFNRTGIELSSDAVDLDDLRGSQAKLAHLAGIDPIELSASQLESIEAYLDAGGTLLIETIGGRGNFTGSIERQLGKHLGTAAQPLARDHAIISGQGLADGYDNRRICYRRFAVLQLAIDPRPRLAAIYHQGRPAVIISDVDLSQGLLNINHWGVTGYAPQSSKQLMTNILLWARGRAE